MKKMLQSLSQMLFPDLCVCCDGYLTHQDESICDFCYLTLPKFESFKVKDNQLAKKFWGRTNAEFVTAYLNYTGRGDVKKILHQIKYKGNRDLGIEMGKALGKCLTESGHFNNIDYTIPIPLHPKREKFRGYNQSDLLVEGIYETMAIKSLKDVVIRKKYNNSQTKKKRYERFINSQEIFRVVDPKKLEGKHVLLIDDVITTGATIEACGEALLEVDGLKLSIASLAVAN